MASVYNKGGYLYISYYVNGVKKAKSLRLKDNRENRRIAEVEKKRIERDSTIPKEALIEIITLDEAMQRFKRYKSDHSPKTLEGYESAFSHLTVFFSLKKKIKSFTNNDFNELKYYLLDEVSKSSKKKLSSNTVASYFRIYQTFFNFLKKEKLFIGENPVPKLKTTSKEILVIPDEHFRVILEYLKDHDIEQYEIIEMLRLSGRRVNEVLSVCKESINFNDGLISIYNKKASRYEYIPIHTKLRELLESIIERKQLKKGNLFNYKNASSMRFWKRALKRLGLPHYPLHSIRKTFATKLVYNNVPIFEASKILGHSNIKTTIDFQLFKTKKPLNLLC